MTNIFNDERFAKQYGFFRPYVSQVIYRYLDCGILHNGFARVKCEERNKEFLIFSEIDLTQSSFPVRISGQW